MGDVCGGGRSRPGTWVGDGGAGRDARRSTHKYSWTYGQRQMNRGSAQRPDIQSPTLTPQRDSREGGRDCREREGGREGGPHCRDRNPERKLDTAEARAGRCCQTLLRAPGLGGEHHRGENEGSALPLLCPAGAVRGAHGRPTQPGGKGREEGVGV